MWSHLSGCHACLMSRYFIDSVLGSVSSLTTHKKSISSFREQTPNGDLSPDPQSVDLSVRSHQITSPRRILVSRRGQKKKLKNQQALSALCQILLTEQEILGFK